MLDRQPAVSAIWNRVIGQARAAMIQIIGSLNRADRRDGGHSHDAAQPGVVPLGGVRTEAIRRSVTCLGKDVRATEALTRHTRMRRLARWTRDGASGGVSTLIREMPKTPAMQGFSFVAGAGFEPATFGL